MPAEIGLFQQARPISETEFKFRRPDQQSVPRGPDSRNRSWSIPLRGACFKVAPEPGISSFVAGEILCKGATRMLPSSEFEPFTDSRIVCVTARTTFERLVDADGLHGMSRAEEIPASATTMSREAETTGDEGLPIAGIPRLHFRARDELGDILESCGSSTIVSATWRPASQRAHGLSRSPPVTATGPRLSRRAACVA